MDKNENILLYIYAAFLIIIGFMFAFVQMDGTTKRYPISGCLLCFYGIYLIISKKGYFALVNHLMMGVIAFFGIIVFAIVNAIGSAFFSLQIDLELIGDFIFPILFAITTCLHLLPLAKDKQEPQQEPQQQTNEFAELIENFAQNYNTQQPPQTQSKQAFVAQLDELVRNYEPPPLPKHSHVLKYRHEWHSALSKAELGKRYERYCGYLLEKDGWEVEYSGIVRGLKDGGIDLRAFREGRMIAAQCKFWERKRKIRSNTISQFIGDLDREIDEHPNLQVIGLFCCKNDNFDTGCKERLQSKGIWIHIKNYDNKYPCVKCIAASGLYYVPQHRDYDAIAFSIHRGDRHCYDEAEAEKLGFREAV